MQSAGISPPIGNSDRSKAGPLYAQAPLHLYVVALEPDV